MELFHPWLVSTIGKVFESAAGGSPPPLGFMLFQYQETHIEENGNQLVIRSKAEGVCGKVFQAVGMAMPPTIRVI